MTGSNAAVAEGPSEVDEAVSDSSDGLLTQRYPDILRAVELAGEELRAQGLLEIKERIDREVSEFLMRRHRNPIRKLNPA